MLKDLVNSLELGASSQSKFGYQFIFLSTSLYTVQNYLSSDSMEQCSCFICTD
jgi:hypothetical protein